MQGHAYSHSIKHECQNVYLDVKIALINAVMDHSSTTSYSVAFQQLLYQREPPFLNCLSPTPHLPGITTYKAN